MCAFACIMSVYHMCDWCLQGPERASDPLEQELQMTVGMLQVHKFNYTFSWASFSPLLAIPC